MTNSGTKRLALRIKFEREKVKSQRHCFNTTTKLNRLSRAISGDLKLKLWISCCFVTCVIIVLRRHCDADADAKASVINFLE